MHYSVLYCTVLYCAVLQVGVFVAKIVPGGQSQRAGLRENDKIVRINNKVRRYFNNSRAVDEVS